MAAPERPAAGVWPPQSFDFEALSLSAQRQYGHGQPLQRAVLAVPSGSWQSGNSQSSFAVNRSTLLALTNELYRLRFFDLQSALPAKRSLYLKDDGSAHLQVQSMQDGTTTTLCFSLPNFQKCVAWQVDAPSELEDWVQRVMTDAAQRAKAGTPTK